MTPRDRLLAVLHGEVPDCVPCCPDISNMVPCRLTEKPFWDIYVYQDPPLWKAYVDAIKHFDLDGGFEIYYFGVEDVLGDGPPPGPEEYIVHRFGDGRFATQLFDPETGIWDRHVVVYTADNPPATNVLPTKLGLPAVPTEWEPITGVRQWPTGMALYELVRGELGEQGVVGLRSGATTSILRSPEDVYSYYDDPEPWRQYSRRLIEEVEANMARIATMDPGPDLVLCGGSGTLVFQTPEIFRDLALPVLKRAAELARDLGIPSHVHSCGPQTELVRMAAEETELTIIDPLEVAPMGDCDLAEISRLYGDRLALKGNLHTTEVLLHGSVDDVVRASRQAIDDAAAGGGFILSSGDQCGRDTPDENIRAILETARTYGRY